MSHDREEGADMRTLGLLLVLFLLILFILWLIQYLNGLQGTCPTEAFKCESSACGCCVKDGFGNPVSYCDSGKCGKGFVLNSRGQCCNINDLSSCISTQDVCVTPPVCNEQNPCCPGYSCNATGGCIPCEANMLCNPADVNSCCTGFACNANGRCESTTSCALKECSTKGETCKICDASGNCAACQDKSICVYNTGLKKNTCSPQGDCPEGYVLNPDKTLKCKCISTVDGSCPDCTGRACSQQEEGQSCSICDKSGKCASCASQMCANVEGSYTCMQKGKCTDGYECDKCASGCCKADGSCSESLKCSENKVPCDNCISKCCNADGTCPSGEQCTIKCDASTVGGYCNLVIDEENPIPCDESMCVQAFGGSGVYKCMPKGNAPSGYIQDDDCPNGHIRNPQTGKCFDSTDPGYVVKPPDGYECVKKTVKQTGKTCTKSGPFDICAFSPGDIFTNSISCGIAGCFQMVTVPDNIPSFNPVNLPIGGSTGNLNLPNLPGIGVSGNLLNSMDVFYCRKLTDPNWPDEPYDQNQFDNKKKCPLCPDRILPFFTSPPDICLDCQSKCATDGAVYDLNGDLILDALDLNVFDLYVASKKPYDRRYDFNNDGVVDDKDRKCAEDSCSGGCRVMNITSITTCINTMAYPPEARQSLGEQIHNNVSAPFDFSGYAKANPDLAAGFTALKRQVVLQVGTSQGQSFVSCISSQCPKVLDSGTVSGVTWCKLYTFSKCSSFSYCQKDDAASKASCDKCKKGGVTICDAISTIYTNRCNLDWQPEFAKGCAGDYESCMNKKYTNDWCSYVRQDASTYCKALIDFTSEQKLSSVCDDVIMVYESNWCKNTINNCIDTLNEPLLLVDRGDPFIYGSNISIEKTYFSGCAYFADPFGGKIKVMELEREPACSSKINPSIVDNLNNLVDDGRIDVFSSCVAEDFPEPTESDTVWMVSCIFSGGASCLEESYCIVGNPLHDEAKCTACKNSVGTGCTALHDHINQFVPVWVLDLSYQCTQDYNTCTRSTLWCEEKGKAAQDECNSMSLDFAYPVAGSTKFHFQQICNTLVAPLVEGKCWNSFKTCYTPAEAYANLARQLVKDDAIKLLDGGTGVTSTLDTQGVTTLPVISGNDCPFGK